MRLRFAADAKSLQFVLAIGNRSVIISTSGFPLDAVNRKSSMTPALAHPAPGRTWVRICARTLYVYAVAVIEGLLRDVSCFVGGGKVVFPLQGRGPGFESLNAHHSETPEQSTSGKNLRAVNAHQNRPPPTISACVPLASLDGKQRHAKPKQTSVAAECD